MIRSISFPNMISYHAVQTVEDRDATVQNLTSLIQSEKGKFTCDPFYGVSLQKYMFEPNDDVLLTMLKDEIYKQVKYFMPQLQISKSDVKLKKTTDKEATISAHITAKNVIDFNPDTYDLVLFKEEQ